MMVLQPWVGDQAQRPWLQNLSPREDPTGIIAPQFGRLVTETWQEGGETRTKNYAALEVLPCFI